jgi:fermentation-respiration switch protein FrsA (DUF1100 family)
MSRKSLCFLLIPLAIAGCAVTLEDKVLFQPEAGAKKYDGPPAPIQDLELPMPDGNRIHGRWVPNPNATGAILYLHGNAGNIDGYAATVRETYDNLNESVLIIDYPGYGYSQGKPSEESCLAAGETAFQWLVQNQKISPGRIILIGQSLGGGVAIDLASRNDYRAMILIRTFTSIPDVADDQFPLLFSEAFVHNRFDSLKKIPLCKQPIMIAQADKDRLIPFRQGKRLAAACTAPVELFVLRGLTHTDPLPRDFYVAAREFLAKTPPR